MRERISALQEAVDAQFLAVEAASTVTAILRTLRLGHATLDQTSGELDAAAAAMLVAAEKVHAAILRYRGT